MQTVDPILQVESLTKQFGGLVAVDQVSFAVRPGSIKAIIGPNGAGKTTIFNLLTGVDVCTQGEILFDGHELSRAPAHAICRFGMARTFQNILLFSNMNVFDNVRAAVQVHRPHGIRDALWRGKAFQPAKIFP